MLLTVETEWPRVERLKAERVIKEVLVCSGLRLRLERPLAGGEVGAALVVLPTGDHAVLTSWPGGQRARALAVDELQAPLRARGYPAPAYLEVVECGAVTAVVQEWIDGTPPQQVDPELLHALFELNDLQVGVLTEQGGSLDDLYLSRDGPGFCLHEPLRRHSFRTSDLLGQVQEVGQIVPDDVVKGTDVVHGDFHPGNVLTAGCPQAVVGVIDWTGARVGNCGLDLVTLGFSVTGATSEQRTLTNTVRRVLDQRVDRAATLAFTAHMALRQVDWAIRHHGDAAIDHWTYVALDWLSWVKKPTRARQT